MYKMLQKSSEKVQVISDFKQYFLSKSNLLHKIKCQRIAQKNIYNYKTIQLFVL